MQIEDKTIRIIMRTTRKLDEGMRELQLRLHEKAPMRELQRIYGYCLGLRCMASEVAKITERDGFDYIHADLLQELLRFDFANRTLKELHAIKLDFIHQTIKEKISEKSYKAL